MKKIIFTSILFVFMVNAVAQLKVNSDGRVGIGTTNPTVNLEVAGTTQTESLLLNKPNNINNWNNLWRSGFYDAAGASNAPEPVQWFWGIHMGHISNNPNYRYGGQIAIRNSNTAPAMYFRSTDINGEGTWAKVLTNAGNNLLSVEYSSPEGGAIEIRNNSKTQSGTANLWKIWNMTGSYGNALQFWAYDDLWANGGLAAPRLILMDNGNVGIGMVNGFKLSVAGNAFAAGLWVSSDERLKTNIKPLVDKKDKIYLLEGKSYNKTLQPTGFEEITSEKKEKDEFAEYGFLAQDLKEIFPDLVKLDSTGYYAVNYIGLIPVIVEALKDQRAENEKQREQIKQLAKLAGIKSIDEKIFTTNGIDAVPFLLQNTPNPFNQTTEIGYYIPETVKEANLYIYDINGLQQEHITISERGKSASVIQAATLRAGIYFYTLICDGVPVDSKQMILTK